MKFFIEVRERRLHLDGNEEIMLSEHVLDLSALADHALRLQTLEINSFTEMERSRLLQSGLLKRPAVFKYAFFFTEEQQAESHAMRLMFVRSPAYRAYTHTSIWEFYQAVGYGTRSRVWLKA